MNVGNFALINADLIEHVVCRRPLVLVMLISLS